MRIPAAMLGWLLMPNWLASLLFALLVVTIPFTLILRIMLQLPKALALSHRRWPYVVNIGVIAVITAYVTIFIRAVYYSRNQNNAALLMEFVIAALAYVFGLVMILRQFSGVYPDYIVSTGRTGLSLRKTVYRNIKDVEEIARNRQEVQLQIITSAGAAIHFTLPTRDVRIFYERLKAEP
jgi:hypothetical protein